MEKINKKGFTLVELVIVIAVIAILAGVLIGTFAGVISRANQSKALQEWKAKVDEAYVVYVADNHNAPFEVKVEDSTVVFGTGSNGAVTSTDFTEVDDAKALQLDKTNNIYLVFKNGSYAVVTGTVKNNVLSANGTSYASDDWTAIQ